MDDDGLDRQGRFWRAMYESGERIESAYPFRVPRWQWLIEFAKRHPVRGSALQGVLFGVLVMPFLLIFVALGLSAVEMLKLGLGAGVFFGVAMYGYNRYVSRHGEPWR